MTKKSLNTNSSKYPFNPDETIGLKIVRLKSSEDIIASVLVEEDKMILTDPLQLIFKRTETGSVLLLLPWLPMEFVEENKSVISCSEILTVMNPKKLIIDYYDSILESVKNKIDEYESEQNLLESTEEQLQNLLDNLSKGKFLQ